MNTIQRCLNLSLAAAALFLATPAVPASAQISAPAPAGAEVAPTNVMCPVTPEEKIDPSIFTDFRGSRVYFCCKRCLRRFEQDPGSFAGPLATVLPAVFGSSRDPVGAPVGEHEHADDEAAGSTDDHRHDGDTSGDSGHDHATDHSVGPLAFLGRFHVVVVHFPIAFLLLAAFIEAAGLVRERWRQRDVVRLVTATGAASAIAAMALGLLHGSASDYAGTLGWVFWWHRALGIAVAITAVAACTAVELRARGRGTTRLATLSLFVAAGLVGVAGHFGGSLVYGWEFLLP